MFILALVFFSSLLFHEYGHALTAQKFGRTPEITLEGFGGHASYDGRGLSDREHVLITLAGPLFTAVLIGISYYLLRCQIFAGSPVNIFLYYIMQLNMYWLLVNLAPLHPLDGGKISEYFFRKWVGSERGYRWNLMLGNITALFGICYFLLNNNFMFAYLFMFYGWGNLQAFLVKNR